MTLQNGIPFSPLRSLGRELRENVRPTLVNTLLCILVVWLLQREEGFWSIRMLQLSLPIGLMAGFTSTLASWTLACVNAWLVQRHRIPLRLTHVQTLVMGYGAAVAGAFLGYVMSSLLILGRTVSDAFSGAALPLAATTLVMVGCALYGFYRHRLAMLQRQADEASFLALRQQVQPHFLFNALNVLSELVEMDSARAAEGLRTLAALYRGILEAQKVRTWPLGRELELVRALLSIEQLRFGKRLAFRFSLPPGTEDLHVPPLLLQTLVENAVKHGIAQLRQGGTIAVRAERVVEGLRIEVENPVAGQGERTGAVGTKTGLANARARLALLYGKEENLTFGLHAGVARASFLVSGEAIHGDEMQSEPNSGGGR